MFDIALSKGGTEAIVESVYSVMSSQAMAGRQSNNTLVQRTKIDWHYPKSSIGIPDLINDATKIINKARRDPFTSAGGASKVITRIGSDTGRIPSFN